MTMIPDIAGRSRREHPGRFAMSPPQQPETTSSAVGGTRAWWGDHIGELRCYAELTALLWHPIFLGLTVPRGDGSPVVVIPGLLADDDVMKIMRGWLRRTGYDAYAAGIGANIDCSDRALDRLETRVEGIVDRTGRPVAIVGHSRGAQFGRALASRRPDLVSALVSLGAPLAVPLDISIPTMVIVGGLRSYLHASDARRASIGCMTADCTCAFARDFTRPWPSSVPCTSIYTRTDGIVWWEACLVPYARCIEVEGSHVGMAFSVPVYYQVAAALAKATAGRAVRPGPRTPAA